MTLVDAQSALGSHLYDARKSIVSREKDIVFILKIAVTLTNN